MLEMCAKIPAPTQRENETCVDDDEIVVNDSLGTVDEADSTGIDEEKETGDAKKNNFPTKED
jgi:hypothetical protein